MITAEDVSKYNITNFDLTAFREDGFHGNAEDYTVEKLFVLLRIFRNGLLTLCDWTQLEDASCDKEAWAEYRQALRDITDGLDNPLDVVWPARPE